MTATVEIPLTRGFVAIVDEEAAAQILGMGSWYARPHRNTVYAVRQVRRSGGQRNIGMHNVIAGASFVDHINGDGLDNRRANLRAATNAQNGQNRRRPATNTSGYKGVGWISPSGPWRARITLEGRCVHLGCFADPVEAARVYDEAASHYYGEFARLNFPGEEGA